jgi:hypothetical protein
MPAYLEWVDRIQNCEAFLADSLHQLFRISPRYRQVHIFFFVFHFYLASSYRQQVSIENYKLSIPKHLRTDQ